MAHNSRHDWRTKREKKTASLKRRRHFLNLAAIEYRSVTFAAGYVPDAPVDVRYGWDTAYYRAFQSGKIDHVGIIICERRQRMTVEAQKFYVQDLILAWQHCSKNVPEYMLDKEETCST